MRKNIEIKVIAFVLALTSFLASSCSREMIPSGRDESKMLSFNASLDDALPKTFLDGVQVKWELNDKLSLWYGTLETEMTQSDYFVGKVGTDARTATLNGFAEESADYLAVYPRSAALDCSKDGKLTLNFPVEQSLKGESFAEEANVAVAYSNTTNLSFKNVGGLLALKVALTGGHTVMKIRLAGTAALSGEIEMQKETLPSISVVTEGINLLTLDCGEGIVDPGKDVGITEGMEEETGSWGNTKSSLCSGTKNTIYSGDTRYYLVSLPGFHTGFVLTFIDKDGKAARLKSNYAFTIDRNSNTLIANVSLTDAMFKSDPLVYINEVDCKNKKIELYNPNNESVDLSGWLLTKDEHSWAFPIGRTIPAKGYYVVNCKQSDCSTGPMFGLSGDKGFDLKLSNGGLVDRIDNLSKITVIGNTETFGRKTNGSSEWVVFSKGTIYEAGVCDGDNSKGTIKGEEPVVPTSVVLNEIDGNVKFIELYNKGSESVSLNGWTLAKNDADVWTGDATHNIAAGSYFVVYSSKCENIPTGAPVFSGGISPKQTLKVSLKTASGTTADTFTRGSSPWGTTISSCTDSFGRTPNGSGTWQLTASTPGTANGASKGNIPQN